MEKYNIKVSNKKELIALSKLDLVKYSKKEILDIMHNKVGKKAYIFSSVTNDGVNDLIKILFKECESKNDQ